MTVHVDDEQNVTIVDHKMKKGSIWGSGIPGDEVCDADFYPKQSAFPGDDPGTKRSSPFAEGQIVHLKSGSPPMTAEPGLRHDDMVAVAYFVGTTLYRDAFHKDALT